MLSASTRSLFLSSGNNVGPVGDMIRRTVVIELDPKCEHPSARTFTGDPLKEVRSRHSHYVACALTIVRAYLNAGAPKTPCPSFGSFGQWSNWVRQSLMWLGMVDPAGSVFEQLEVDPVRDMLGRLMQAWHDVYVDKPVRTKHVTRDAGINATKHAELYDVLEDIAGERGDISSRRLGIFLSKYEGRRVNGFQIQKHGTIAGNAAQWCVVKT
jgi:hypothetical protein